MKSSIRKMDDMGRIAIPKVMRQIKCLKEGDMLEISLTEEGILIKKAEDQNK